ncbi:MAG TPA: hypothetical protein VNH11_04325 [Pirellulales bacterium]|nr:hypothetical protein [Pirellulales bacterium]
MKKTLWLAILIIAIVVVSLWPLRNPWPDACWQPFSSWGDAWVLPPRPSGAYMIYLAYHKKDGGRLDSATRRTDIKLTVIDETDGSEVPLLRDWEYGQIGPNKDWQMEEVGDVRLVEGHRYHIEVDAEQLKQLSRYRHKLGVDLDVYEKMNWGKPKKRPP